MKIRLINSLYWYQLSEAYLVCIDDTYAVMTPEDYHSSKGTEFEPDLIACKFTKPDHFDSSLMVYDEKKRAMLEDLGLQFDEQHIMYDEKKFNSINYMKGGENVII